jgi:3-oxoadipate enol-lactonase
MWDGNIPMLARRYRILRYDSRGHGSSDVPAGPYDIERLARDVLDLIDGLELDAVDFCGASVGGMVGIWLAASAGGRMRRLVLSNTTAYIEQPEALDARIEAVRWGGGMAAVADTMLERWFTPSFRTANPAIADRMRKMLLATPPSGYIATCQAVRDMDQRSLLEKIAAPTLVVAGKHDPATATDQSHYLRDRIRGARLVELEAAHVANIEAATAFDRALLEFLGES